jgi:hypothetical protein
MKRTAKAFAVVAGLGAGLGGCMAPKGEQAAIEKTAKAAPVAATSSAVMQAKAEAKQAERVARGQMMYDPNVKQVHGTGHLPENSPEFGPQASRLGMMMGHGGILPSPGMGPPGAVAGVGFGGPSQFGAYSGQRTSVRFASPAGMKIAFQDPARGFVDAGREAPVRYNFPQGNIYRVRVSGIPNRPGKNYYPTIEVYPSTMKTVTFLSHSTVPVGFTDEDLDQVNSGNLVVKVIYLPDPQFQDLAVAEEIVSTRLEAGVDPIMEANRRGTILAIVRIGNIDLEDPNTPAMDAPGTFAPPAPRPGPTAPLPTPMAAPGSAMRVPDSLPAINVPGMPK